MDSYALRPAPSLVSCCRQTWTLNVKNWPSTVASTVNSSLTTVRFIQYITLSVHLCRAKLTTRCDDRRAAANFNAEFATKFQNEVLLFLEIREFFQKNGVG